jgi:hypothetical protein
MVFSGMLRHVALVRATRRNIPEDTILHSLIVRIHDTKSKEFAKLVSLPNHTKSHHIKYNHNTELAHKIIKT